ncbi:hypothetical protein EZS27_010886 [termite gut metagenome]|uniref:Lipoprotein n=1 Tax=termite gut metagenome TaxID=433724 RepID=A0A5J4S5E5_9ZZZZ
MKKNQKSILILSLILGLMIGCGHCSCENPTVDDAEEPQIPGGETKPTTVGPDIYYNNIFFRYIIQGVKLNTGEWITLKFSNQIDPLSSNPDYDLTYLILKVNDVISETYENDKIAILNHLQKYYKIDKNRVVYFAGKAHGTMYRDRFWGTFCLGNTTLDKVWVDNVIELNKVNTYFGYDK